MKKLYLHIGTHKTGSTALQKAIRDNEKKLKKEGFLVLKTSTLSFIKKINRSDDPGLFVDEFSKVLNNAFLRSGKVILSWEGFSGSLLGQYKNRERVFQFIADAMPNDVNLDIICFLRRQDDFLQSAFSQAKHQGEFESADKLLKVEYQKGFDWAILLTDLENQLPNAEYHMLPYDPYILEKQSVVELYGETIGSIVLKKAKTKQANVGMSKDAALLYERLYDDIGSSISKKYFRKLLQQNMNKGLFKEYQHLDYESKVKLLEHYQSGNRSIAKRFWKEKYGIDDFSPIKEIREEMNGEMLQERVIIELLNEYGKGKQKDRRSWAIRLGRKLNALWGI